MSKARVKRGTRTNGQIPEGSDQARKRRVVVCGEFSSGKSSLINLLLRRPVLSPSVGKTRALPIRIANDGNHQSYVIAPDGQRTPSLDDQPGQQATDAVAVDILTPMTDAPDLEIIELPAPGEGALPTDWVEIVASAGLFVWCTIASQSWRLSEKACIEQLPEPMRSRSVLAVTRSDLLRSGADRRKIAKRLSREAGEYFSDILFIGAGGAQIAEAQNAKAWAKSGGAELAGIVHAIADDPSHAPLKLWSEAAAAPEPDQSAEPEEPAVRDPGAGQQAPTEHTLHPPQQISPAVPQFDMAGLADVPGFIAACVVETDTAACLSRSGDAGFDEICARGSQLLRLEKTALCDSADGDNIEEIVVSTQRQFQMIRQLDARPNQHVVLLISRVTGNLAQALRALRSSAG